MNVISGEIGTKRDLISTSRELADLSEHLTHLAKQLASECTDRRMRTVRILIPPKKTTFNSFYSSEFTSSQ